MENSGACCRNETKTIKCAEKYLKKLNKMFADAFESSCAHPTAACESRDTGMVPAASPTTVCTRENNYRLKPNGRSDRNAMRLLPGEVGLRDDRATFSLSRRTDRPAPVTEDGLPTGGGGGGTVHYNVRPTAGDLPSNKRQRKHVVEVLPRPPASTEPTVGPVTGLPVGEDEHVFVLRLGKRDDEPDEKARLQIEMRIPKRKQIGRTDVGTQYSEADVQTTGGAAGAGAKKKKTGRDGAQKKSGAKKKK